MKKLIYLICICFLFIGASHKNSLNVYNKIDDNQFEVWSIVEFLGNHHLINYKIKTSNSETTEQEFISDSIYTSYKELEKSFVQIKSKKGNWIPYNDKKVLFIQLFTRNDSEEENLKVENKRDIIADRVEEELLKSNNGSWFASDDGNNLFFVNDENKALEVSYKIIKELNLESNVLISKRVYINDKNWFYEVKYPLNYSGKFDAF